MHPWRIHKPCSYKVSGKKNPEILAVLYRLSSSSFYMYLARQSSQQAHHKSTLFWVRKPLQVMGLRLFSVMDCMPYQLKINLGYTFS
ncbi:MAG: hypothetical protein BRC43_06675 [Cyanobacteria bacterium QS_3_48_167]|nr:MAG: hypothetical protein BRC43_06675 [Cyanobacteria bacterium QS_3_48_167]